MVKTEQRAYSQGSLQDFSECQRRYYYRYRMRLVWPAAEMEPIAEYERLQKLGRDFHLLVQQSLSGVPSDSLAEMVSAAPDLARWWHQFKDLGLNEAAGDKFPEIVFRGRLDDFLLVAKYDLIHVSPEGEVVIYDWKTSRRQPDQTSLASRWQSILYPYLLAQKAGQLWPGRGISPGKIRMVYWFANFPEKPVELPYTPDLHEDHEGTIRAAIEEIETKDEIDEFLLTDDENRCKFCIYRSLCDRGTTAGAGALDLEADSLEGFEIDMDQVQEIEL